MQPARVGLDRCRLQPGLEAHPGGGEAGFPVIGRGGGNHGEIAWFQAQLERRRLGRGQRLQVIDHPAQPQYLLVQRGGLLGGVRHDPVQQRLGVGLQHRDRGPQLMGDVGDEITPQLLLGAEGVGHLVEGNRQVP